MKRNIKEYAHIKDSLNQSFIFHIDHEFNLVFKELDENGNYLSDRVIENNMIDFSASIDKKDRIHLIYLLGNGELKYSIYINGEWQKSLVRRLDIKSNIYKYLNLFLHEEHINIFYAFTNIINTSLWTIEHITKDSSNWRQMTVTNIFCEGNFTPFYLDKDKFGNLSLVYKAKEYNTNHIYYTAYNVFINEWGKSLTKISYSETDNVYPYLFIDSQDNIHVLWYSLDNNNYLITYKQLSAVGKKKYNWEEIRLPKTIGAEYLPIMFENKNELNILCVSKGEIHSLVSKNYGLNWNLENKIPLNDQEVHLIKHVHNDISSSGDKVNHYYGNIDDNKVHFYFAEEEDVSTSDFKNDVQKINDLEKEDEQKIAEIEVETEHEIEVQNEIETETETEIERKREEELLILNGIVDRINDIKNDVELIKEKVQKIEEKQNTKKGFFK